jgi:hypothetical protein
MAKFMEFTPEQQQEFDAWLAERPPLIQDIVEKYPPDRLYRLKTTKQRVTIQIYHVDGTVTVFVSGQYNLCVFDRNVFGISVTDLEECDMPTEEEMTGTVLTEQESIDDFIETTRPYILREKNGQ